MAKNRATKRMVQILSVSLIASIVITPVQNVTLGTSGKEVCSQGKVNALNKEVYNQKKESRMQPSMFRQKCNSLQGTMTTGSKPKCTCPPNRERSAFESQEEPMVIDTFTDSVPHVPTGEAQEPDWMKARDLWKQFGQAPDGGRIADHDIDVKVFAEILTKQGLPDWQGLALAKMLPGGSFDGPTFTDEFWKNLQQKATEMKQVRKRIGQGYALQPILSYLNLPKQFACQTLKKRVYAELTPGNMVRNNMEQMSIDGVDIRVGGYPSWKDATEMLISQLEGNDLWEKPGFRAAFKAQRKSEFGLWGKPVDNWYGESQYYFDVCEKELYIQRRNTRGRIHGRELVIDSEGKITIKNYFNGVCAK